MSSVRALTFDRSKLSYLATVTIALSLIDGVFFLLSTCRKLIIIAAVIIALLPVAVRAQSTTLFQANFDADSNGPYTTAELNADFHNPPWADGVNFLSIVDTPLGSGHSLQMRYPAGQVSSAGAAIIPVPLGATYNDVYVSFSVMFAQGFDFVREGKLSGLCGGTCNSGGSKPNGTDGWSSRVLWRLLPASGNRPDAAAQYIYNPDQTSSNGDMLAWNNAIFTTGVWYQVVTRVKMNTPGQHNGVIQSWFDGALAFEIDTERLTDIASLGVDQFRFETFFGGGSSIFAPPKDEYAYFDNISVYTAPSSPTPTVTLAPPTSTSVAPTATSIPPTATNVPSTATLTPVPLPTATLTLVPPSATLRPTNTSVPPTATIIPTNTTAPVVSLKVQYRDGEVPAVPGNQTIKAFFNIINTGNTTVNLSDLKIRYYFNPDGASPMDGACDYANIGKQFVTITFGQGYEEVGFTGGTLAPGQSTKEIQTRLSHHDWINMDETNDYSYGGQSGFLDWPKAPLFMNGALVWGTPG